MALSCSWLTYTHSLTHTYTQLSLVGNSYIVSVLNASVHTTRLHGNACSLHDVRFSLLYNAYSFLSRPATNQVAWVNNKNLLYSSSKCVQEFPRQREKQCKVIKVRTLSCQIPNGSIVRWNNDNNQNNNKKKRQENECYLNTESSLVAQLHEGFYVY